MKRIRVEAADGIGRITLSRPEKKNALDEQAAAELSEALARFAADGAVRAVLLAADGKDFCAGADLEALERALGAEPDAQLRDAKALGSVFEAMRRLPQPVVAAVRGRALAGGAGLATACDIIVASDDARFGYPEVGVGFVPAMVMTMLRRAMGEKRAFDLVATGRVIDAQEALALGLVSRVVPAATFDDEVENLVNRLAAAPPSAIRITKRLFYDLDSLDFAAGLDLGARVNVEARATDEFREGVRGFVARRKSAR
ncbi:MAG TPA: enoyl-CoA hydratase-related protein [Gemmatimonadaceae bacterium]|nr:enoyl-CoA hydratase-related protein [Gemmatimonadaceae bacterium]